MSLSSVIYVRPPSSPITKAAARTYLIYHITGNPGLIEYYRTFLTHLYGSLTTGLSTSLFESSSIRPDFHIYGRSFNGFEVDGSSSEYPTTVKTAPYSLEQQIVQSQRVLEEVVKNVTNEGAKDVRVILMGHSVGSYILLDMIRRVRAKHQGVRVIGGICLFPTVMDIAKSESGKMASPLLALPHAPYLISLVAKALTFCIPVAALAFLIRLFMNFPSDAAHVTASFVKSRHGVHQALYMAHDEMQTITADLWDDEIWGAAQESKHTHARPVLRFLFAKKDHWVANETRDELIKVRGRMEADGDGDGAEDEAWKPKMEVDEDNGWPHGFCIRHSGQVASTVTGYVRDIILADLELEGS